jgi:hypothetical protein
MPIHRWTDRIGRSAIQDIVKLKIPQWKDGLRDYQLDMAASVLDRKNVLISLGTGRGKTAGFAVPMLVLREISSNPDLYPDLRYPKMAVGIVITPTKGLSFDIVRGLNLNIFINLMQSFQVNQTREMGVTALAYNADTLTDARKLGRNLKDEIIKCHYQLICLDPETITARDWRIITDDALFFTLTRAIYFMNGASTFERASMTVNEVRGYDTRPKKSAVDELESAVLSKFEVKKAWPLKEAGENVGRLSYVANFHLPPLV